MRLCNYLMICSVHLEITSPVYVINVHISKISGVHVQQDNNLSVNPCITW